MNRSVVWTLVILRRLKHHSPKILKDNTIIFSTHDIHLAVELADIFIFLHPEGVTDLVPLLNILI
jgi:ABC-type proline/glycine betaine transport system ATPase subunit